MSELPKVDPPPCPVCRGHMEVVYNRYHQIVAVRVDCHTGLTVPDSSREVARLKREGKWIPHG
jgi:hypothetical protein